MELPHPQDSVPWGSFTLNPADRMSSTQSNAPPFRYFSVVLQAKCAVVLSSIFSAVEGSELTRSRCSIRPAHPPPSKESSKYSSSPIRESSFSFAAGVIVTRDWRTCVIHGNALMRPHCRGGMDALGLPVSPQSALALPME